MTPSVAISEIGTASAGMTVAETRRRNRKMTMITSATVSASVNCTSCTASRIEIGAVVQHVQDRRARQLALKTRQQGLDAVDDVDGVGFRLTEDTEDDGAAAVVPARGLIILDEFVTTASSPVAPAAHCAWRR